MSRLTVILAATDFSPAAERALARAMRLAKTHDARVELVHTFDAAPVLPAWGDPGGGAWVGEKMFMDGVREQLEQTRATLAAAHRVEIRANLEVGPAHRQIAMHAQRSGADLIVIGASGASSVLRRLLGSTAQNVVRSSHVPVLVVRRDADADYASLIAGIDFSEDSDAAARFAQRLAPGACLHLLHVFESVYDNALARTSLTHEEQSRLRASERTRAEEALSAVAAQMRASGAGEVISHLLEGSADSGLETAIDELGADLLALGAHGKTRWEAGLLGSTSQHAVSHAHCDVLVWRRLD